MGFSQRIAGVAKTHEKSHFNGSTNRVQMDTLWGQYDDWVTPSVFVAVNNNAFAGFVAGNNNFQDKQKVQVFPNTTNTPLKITGVILWFGQKSLNSGNAASKVIAKTYDLDGSTPGNSTSTEDLLVNDIDTTSGNWNIITFATPASYTSGFAAGIDVTNVLAGDYIGLYSSENGGGSVYNDQAWEQWADNSWNSFSTPNASGGWGLDIQLGIFPIVDTDVVGMKSIINDKFKIYQNMPNPFSNTSNVFYELSEAANVSLEVFDMTGKPLGVYNEGFKSAGKSMIKIDATAFQSGIYHYTITINGQKATRKMVVFK